MGHAFVAAVGSRSFTVLDWIELLMQVLKVLEGHTGGVWTVAISVDGSKIVSGSDDKTVRIWSAETGEVLDCMPARLLPARSHTDHCMHCRENDRVVGCHCWRRRWRWLMQLDQSTDHHG